MKLLVFALCLTAALADEWTKEKYPNPLKDPGTCNRPEASYVCDPDNILDVVERNQLDRQLEKIFNGTSCPCGSRDACLGSMNKGYRIGIALMEYMDAAGTVNPYATDNKMSDEEMAKKVGNNLNEAQLFAFHILNKWKMGRCGDDLVILYSRGNNVVYTFTGEQASYRLKPNLITEITLKEYAKFGPGKSVLPGLRNILSNYEAVLKGQYSSTTNSRRKPRAEAVRSGKESGVSQPMATMMFTAVLSMAATLALHW